jgi:sigma-B regulation protein RsbU (phosphoserine phosphatase)
MMRTLSERARKANGMALEALRHRLELEHLHQQLEVAKALQMSMLPRCDLLFSLRTDVDVCAWIEPAESVGGDFYDAFIVGEGQYSERIFICVGDVAGHGITAALMMARTIGLVRSIASICEAPAQVLSQVNRSLCEGNTSDMFVTLFCGFLYPSSGRFVYSNAGHCPPLLVHQGSVEPLALPRGPLAGVLPGARYSDHVGQFERGDTLLTYTDGVIEAEDPRGRPFGIEGCRQLLQQCPEAPLPELIDRIRAALEQFSGDRKLEDDCTLLMLHRT